MTAEYGDEIKRMLNMQDVAAFYGFDVDRRFHKIRCPFHNDTQPSLQLYSGQRGFYCFVCQTGGSVIDFVMRLFDLSFQDACKKLNDDFRLGLPIGEKLTPEQEQQAMEARLRRQEAQRRRAEKEKQLWTTYNAAYDRFVALDIMAMQYAPKAPDQPIAPEYVYAVKRIDGAWAGVLEAAEQLRQFEERSGT